MNEKLTHSRTILYLLAGLGILAFHGPQLWLMWFLHFPPEGPGTWFDGLFNAGVFLTWATSHSLMARETARKGLARMFGEDFAKLAYVVVAGIAQCAMLYLWRPLPGALWRAEGVWYWVMTIAFLGTGQLVMYCSLMLDYMEALGIRSVLRRIRNEPATPAKVSIRGPYAYCRHPVYLATIFFLWVGPVMATGRLIFALMGTIYILIGCRLEDSDTRNELGQAYEEYCKNVPMLIPRTNPWRPPKGNA